jgi:hypothetical protein
VTQKGTRVGSVYVKATVDGDGIEKDLVDDVDRAGDGIADKGEEHGEAYGDRFSEGFRDRMRKRMPKTFDKISSKIRGEKVGEEVGDDVADGMVERISARAKEMGDKAGKALGDRMASRPEAMRRGIHRAFDDDFADRIATRFADRLTESLGDRMELMLANAMTDAERMLSKIKVSGNRSNKAPGDGEDDGLNLSGMVGKFLGKGSRNNFFNLLGGMGEGVTKIMLKMGNVIKGTFGLFKTGAKVFMEGFSQAAEGASLLSKIGSGFASVGSRMGASLASAGAAAAAAAPVAIAAILAVVAALVVLTSVISALIGIVTALTSTIASGLVGALAVAGPLLASVAAAGGLVAIAFTSMTEKQKQALSEAFQPFKAMVTGLGQAMLQQMVPAFQTWSKNLQAGIAPLGQYAAAFGRAFANAGNILTGMVSGPGFKAFTTALGTYLPSIVRNLSWAFRGFMNGLMGMFAVIMPYVNQFSEYLRRVGIDFSRWANSAQGRNSIKDFVDRALSSLRSLWGAVKQIGGLISDIFFNNQVQRAGNGMFDGITREVGKMRRAFATAAADGSLKRWLDSAARFGKGLWAVIKGLFAIFKALQNSGVIDFLAAQMQALGIMFRVGAVFIRLLTGKIPGLGGALTAILGPIGAVISALNGLVDVARWAFDMLNKIPGVDVGGGGGGSAAYSGPGYSPGAGVVRDGHGRSYSTGRRVNGRGVPYRPKLPTFSGGSLIGMGNTALDNTYESDGGYMPDPSTSGGDGGAAARRAAAAERRRAARERAAERRRMIREANKTAQENLRIMKNTRDLSTFRQSRKDAMDALDQTGKRGRVARRVFRNRTKINEQRGAWLGSVDSQDHPRTIARMVKNTNSLGTIVYARDMIRKRLEKANQKLADAIALKAEFKKSVADGVRTYGGILTAEAQTLNGIQQALTAGDITSNLQKRLDKIKQFNSNMQILLAQGLSKAAYKQLMEGGVEGSSDAAAALVAGGAGAVQQVNSLVSQISTAGNAMGEAAASRLYQAGVDAARGLVAGLESMDDRLDKAAERIGQRISNKIKNSLGIKSPSRVMIANMAYVGDGLVAGLDRQHKKVESATARLGQRIAVSPEVAAYASKQGQPATVSGNGPLFRDFVVQTPTEDPKAVAAEALNEMTARL